MTDAPDNHAAPRMDAAPDARASSECSPISPACMPSCDAYRDAGAFSVYIMDLERLMRRMAQHGEWRQAFDYLAEVILAQTSVRDYLREEKMVQGFLAAYLGAADHFLFSTGREFGKGFVDFCLEPFVARHPRARHGYLIELKYLAREDDEAKLDAAMAEAAAQLGRYLADDYLRPQGPDVAYTGIAIALHGWELARCEAVEPSLPSPPSPRSSDLSRVSPPR